MGIWTYEELCAGYDPWDMVDFRLDLEIAVQKLTDKQREALGPWLAGYTQEEIGENLGVSQRAISYRITSAVARLRELLA